MSRMFLEPEDVGQPLMVKAGGGDRGPGAHREEQGVEDHLRGPRDDAGASGRSDDEDRAAVTKDDRR